MEERLDEGAHRTIAIEVEAPPAKDNIRNRVNRYLSRKEKSGSTHRRDKSQDKSQEKSSEKKTRPLSSEGIIALFRSDPRKKAEKNYDIKIQTIKQRFNDLGYTGVEDDQITYALDTKHSKGNAERAIEMVVLFQESLQGIIKSYNPDVHMKGAENREGVTCYLDALLFAMFARLGSFEPILYTTFQDEPSRRLSLMIRLWVNMLRTGKLIQTDITAHLQEAIAACGWGDAAKLEQQDTSEAFSFITEKLQLPLLTLKMDIYHTGAEDDADDHKFIHERLLEVAVPEEPSNGHAIQLEDCLESYFNNRVEVVRRLERSNTRTSMRSAQSPFDEKGEAAQHVEISNVSWSRAATPSVSTETPAAETPVPVTPTSPRHRTTSIIRHRAIAENEAEETSATSDAASTRNSIRKGSIRKEVLMPAWQFFNLIPWYTANAPVNDREVAAHFSQTRPVLGICLKRYAMSADGHATRKNTFIDIPLDIRLPHFIEDDKIGESGPLMGNFKLSLQSVICHRGNSLTSGHYISFIRGTTQTADGDYTSTRRLSDSSLPPAYQVDRWIKFDDLCGEDRVAYVDIEQALKDEMPYLLFYQVQPTFDTSLDPECLPPSYTDSGIAMRVSQSSPQLSSNPEYSQQQGYFDDARDDSAPTIRFSSEIERPRRSLNLPDRPSEDRRGSVAFTDASIGSLGSLRTGDRISAPVTPNEETTAQRMSRAAARFTKPGSKSRSTSQSGENRISATFSRLAMMRSKEPLNKGEFSTDAAATDGAADPQKFVALEGADLKPENGMPSRKTSKRGRRREKSKAPSDKAEHDHHPSHKGKAKDKNKDVPDRECTIM